MVLLTILRKLKRKERELRLLVLGLDSAGKSSIVCTIEEGLKENEIGQVQKITAPSKEALARISPTFGFAIKTIPYKSFKLNLWDVGGQTTIRAYWRNYFEETDAIIWVVDSSDRLRMEDCAAELESLLKEERLLGASLLVYANKQDITGCMSVDEITTALRLSDIITHHWHIIDCSAVTGQNIETGLNWLVKDVAARNYVYD